MTRRNLLLRWSFVASLIFVTLGPLPASVGAQPVPPPATLRIATGSDDNAAPLLYADRAGLFKKAGLNLEVTRLNSGAAVAAAVAGGAIDIGKSSLLNLLSAHLKGIPFTLVAPAGLHLSDHAIGAMIVATQSSIRTGADINGKIISTAGLKDINVAATDAWVDQHGGDSSTIKWVELPPLDALGALTQGRIDGATIVNPMMTQAINTGKARIAVPMFDGIANRYLLSAWFANKDYVDAHRDVIERFAAVMRDAEAFANAHPEATIDVIAQFTGLDANLIAHMNHSLYPAALDRRDIQPIIETAVKYKLLDRTFDAQEVISPYAVKPAR